MDVPEMVAPLALAVPPSRAPTVVTPLPPPQLARVFRHMVSEVLVSAGIVRVMALACVALNKVMA